MIKRIAITCLIVIFGITALSLPSQTDAKTRVRGYVKRSGKYVAPHYRTIQNKIKRDNWSSKGNFNPYTGKKATREFIEKLILQHIIDPLYNLLVVFNE